MDDLYLATRGDLVCRITADKDILSKIAKDQFTFHFMIGSNVISNRKKSDVHVIQDNHLKKEPVILNYPSCRFGKLYDHREVVVLGEYLLERCRQEKKGYYNVSSTSASLENKAITFYGGSTNLGKTSFMLTLVQKCGFDFLSDEKTIIDLANKKIIPGAVSIPNRKEILQKRFFKSENLPEYIKLKQTEKEKEASLFIYPHLDHGLKTPIYYKWPPLDFFWLLTRELSHEIRGGIRLVNNFSYLLPSLDNMKLTKKRVSLTKKFCDEVPCYYFQGSLDQVIKYIPKILQENARKKYT